MKNSFLQTILKTGMLGLALCLSSVALYGQTKELDSLKRFIATHPTEDDSLATVLARLSYLHNAFDPDQGLVIGQRGLEISQRIDFPEGISRSYNALGVNYFAKDQYDLALEAYDQAIKYKEIIGDDRGAMMTRINVGVILVQHRELNKALDYYEEAKAYFESIEDDNLVGVVLVNMAQVYNRVRADAEALRLYHLAIEYAEKSGNQPALATSLTNVSTIYSRLGEYEESLKMRRRSLKITRETNNKRLEGQVSIGIGRIFQRLDQNDSARFYFQSAYDIADKIGIGSSKARALQNLGSLERKLGNLTVALDYYKESMALRKKSNSKSGLAFLHRNMGKIYVATGQKEIGLEYMLKGLAIGEEGGAMTSIAEGSGDLAAFYESEGDIEKAFYYYKKSQEAREAIESRLDVTELSKLITRYRSEKEKQAFLLEKAQEEAALQKQIESQGLVRDLGLAGFTAMLILASVYYWFYQSKRKANARLEEQNRLISEQKDALSLQAEKLKVVNSQLEMIAEFRTGLTQMIAHDMKNPLNAIIGLSGRQPSDRNVKKIAESGHQMLNLVTNMLEVEKLEETRIKPEMQEVFIDELIQKAKVQVEILLQAKSIVFQSLVPKQICLMADEGILVRVLVNLFTNAVKYSENGGMVKVTHEVLPEGFLRLSVKDEGPGIEPERLPHIFNKFWQSDQKKSGLAVSTGLGLTFCKMALESHGGRIWATSKKNQGTVFTFELDMSQEACREYVHLRDSRTEAPDHLINLEELSVIEVFTSDLIGLKVHEVGAITRILKKMDDQGVNSRWKLDLQAAVYDGDQAKYDHLLNILYKEHE
ncbi:MAG: hypothetical protein Roseis2KO_53450 [Roseivirga sp.]